MHDSKMGSTNIYTVLKDWRRQSLTDFRILNKFIKRKPYPLPKIADSTKTGRVYVGYSPGLKYEK